MSRLFLDITELAAWQGKLTGVPRVMDELLSRFAKTTDCTFVIWDGLLKMYQKIDFAAVHEKESNKTPRTTSGLYSVRPSRVIAVTNRLKRHSRIVTKALILPEKAARKLAPKTSFKAGPPRTVEPKKGDTLFVLADWHGSDEVFVQYLVKLQNDEVKLAQMSYDLLPIVTPQYSGHATVSLTNYTRQIYPICNVIVTISKHTKRDIAGWLKQNELNVPKIEVIRLGDDFKLAKPSKPTIPEVTAGTGYVLCVGTIEARKNHTLLYYAYKLAAQRSIDLPDIVIVGRRGWKSDDIYEIITNDPQVKDKFIVLENASDENLSWLYKNCLFSVYPSFYEGWGLPIAESIAYGAPCICSNTSSMPEVAGDLVNYFSPFSSDECLQAINEMLRPGAIDEAKRKITAYKPTSWSSTFNSVSEIIGGIHGENN